MAYCKPFFKEDFEDVQKICRSFVDAVQDYKEELLQRPKFHLMLHLTQNMLDFGPTAAFNTERYIAIGFMY